VTGRHLAVTAIGLLVTTYLSRQVPEVIGRDFTATMESGLDDIAAGSVSRIEYLTRFWTQELEPAIGRARAEPPTLVLPHLKGVTLLSSQEGPKLQRAGQQMLLPELLIPADLTEEAVTAILEGKWRPSRAKSESASEPTENNPPRRKTSSNARKPAQKQATSGTTPKKPRRKTA
jgi:DNA topoisomerase-1